ncbi:MAG: TonB-dependent receptor [Pseudomonadota bacterium]
MSMLNTKASNSRCDLRKLLLATVIMPAAATAGAAAQAQDDEPEDQIIVTGIRASLADALAEKRAAPSLVEVIKAEDIGKLPDQNLAEVLENITGIQITRRAGVGSGVQIRGENANRIEFNGISTVGSGAGRTGIDFEDVNPAIISAVEVIKSPIAKTIEGSVGGTINLRTIRPTELGDEFLASIRLQGEQNNLSTTGIKPRVSAALGNNWSTSVGEIGFVVSGSYTQQEAVSFRPRADRDNVASPPGAVPPEFLGIQFLVQEQENDDYETINVAGTLEWAPSDDLKFSFDAIVNDQERAQDSYRLQASGVSSLRQISIPTAFETVDFQVGPGEFPAALQGTLEPDLANDDDDPNLRFSSDTGARITTSKVFALAGDWQRDNLSARLELATTQADTRNPNLSTTLNFINPNCPLDGAPSGDPSTSNDNCVPFIYDLSNDSLAFGINFDSPFAPTPADLTNPNNVVLDQIDVGRNTTENRENAARVDFSYDFTDNNVVGDFLTSVDFGYRYNESSSRFEDIDDRVGGFSRLEDSPNGSLFADILVEGPTNYGDSDGRSLFISNFLLVDPDLAFDDPDRVIEILEAALAAQRLLEPGADGDLVVMLSSDQNSFYDVTENTHAAYLQANFEHGVIRGNFGLRYVNTAIDSVAFGPADASGTRSLVSTPGSYEFLLPRFNLAANVTDNFVIRLGYTEDIRRPNFDDLNTAFTFDPQENSVVNLGNPSLQPETVSSIDASFEWYFAPASIFSVGYFRKDRTNLFGEDFDGAEIIDGPTPDGFVTTGGFSRDTDPNCPGGGIFNPTVIPNQLGDPDRLGLCVDFTQPSNDPAVVTQEGIEVAFQYTLAEWEDRLGFASGFGLAANYTWQQFSGGSRVDTTSGRGLNVLGDVSIPRGLLDFSQHNYNVTAFYEKFGLSARARWTWRDSFRTQDFGGGANTSGSSTFSFPVTTLARGQLNASIQYAVTDQFSVGIEGVNLTRSNIIQRCVAETGPTCFVGYPDRRIQFGGTYRF